MLLSFTDGQGTPETEPSGYRRARLYAGVGLVLDSRIPEEMKEVDAKLLTAGRALGPWIRDEPWVAEGAVGSKDE